MDTENTIAPKWLEVALDLARTHDWSKNKTSYRLCAIIVRGGRVISVGFNDTPKNSYTIRAIFHKNTVNCISTHAECSAIHRAQGNLSGAKIYVVRLLANGNPAIARPCSICHDALVSAGIRKIHYTVSGGGWAKETVHENWD